MVIADISRIIARREKVFNVSRERLAWALLEVSTKVSTALTSPFALPYVQLMDGEGHPGPMPKKARVENALMDFLNQCGAAMPDDLPSPCHVRQVPSGGPSESSLLC